MIPARRTARCGIAPRGSALVELLIALPLVALLGALGIALLLAAHRQGSGTDARLGATRELRHAAAALTADLRPLGRNDLVAWTDTSIEFDATIATGVACATRYTRTAVHLVAHDAPSLAAAATTAPPQAGDALTVSLTGPAGRSGPPATTTITDVGGSAACATSPTAHGGPALRLDVAPLPTTVAEGTPARVTRRTRYSLYRASDGAWFLGRRSRFGMTWETVQPVAGPLHAPGARGLRVAVRDSAGVTVASPGTAALLTIAMRAPRPDRRRGAGGDDSTSVTVALRSVAPP